jgi:hypothetical protein
MTLEQISYFSQTIAALAVIVSLIYAALQFRIYTKASREARLVAAGSDIQDFRRMLATNPDCARIFFDGLAGLDQLDAIEKHRFNAMMQSIVTQAIYLNRFRDIPAEIAPAAIFGQQGARQWWAATRGFYAAHVVDLMDARFAAIDASGAVGAPGETAT